MRARSIATLLFAATALLVPARPSSATRTETNPCLGDCDMSQSVTVDELISLVSTALSGGLSACAATADVNQDGRIAVDEIIIAVNHALTGCYEVGSCDDPAVSENEPLCSIDKLGMTCDFLNEEHCLLPYPSSVFLKPDPSTPTGFRVNYPREGMPLSVRFVHIDPAEHNTLDGFSPGPVIMAYIPGIVDLEASGVAGVTTMERSLDENHPTVLLDATTGERIAHMVEDDEQALDPSKKVLMIRPAVRLKETHRYIVALRNLIAANGAPVTARRSFAVLRDNITTPVRTIEARRPSFEDIFTKLQTAGVARDNLILAWDFVVASTESLTGRMLSARDQGLAINGPGAPPFTITSVEEFTPEQDSNILRRVRGKFTVPSFMTRPGPNARYNLGPDGVPVQNGFGEYDFTVNIPRSTIVDGVVHPARPCVYGHGLFGSRDEVNAGHLRAFSNRVNLLFGATEWIGMSGDDVPHVIRMISDLSGFAIIPDRLQQGMLNFILLGRLFISDDGFVSHPAFQHEGQALIDTEELFYYGLSQGSIGGATYLAVAPDTKRGVLGVGASNYSFLLQRSIDFNPFQIVLNLNYYDAFDRALLYPLLQQIWDRGEPQGYQSHLIEDPLPGTPAKKVLLQVGVNDSQVSYHAARIQARSLGIPTIDPPQEPIWGIPAQATPFDDSAYVEYNVNGAAAPLVNLPPTFENGVHEAVRRLRAAQDQIDAFLRTDGKVENFCEGPCRFENVPDVKTGQ